MSKITNVATAQLFLEKINETPFTKVTKKGSINDGDTREFYLPIVQSYSDYYEYFFCVRGTQVNPNRIITPKDLLIERDQNGDIINVSCKDEEDKSNDENLLYVLYKSEMEFHESTQPNHEYILTKCRAINLDTLVNFGKLVSANINGKKELVYFCYRNKEGFFSDLDTSGIDNYQPIPLFTLAKSLFSNRGRA